MDIHHILRQHWGYSSFRPLQEEIIQSVLNGDDTLALLPTGGGKSITFQVPAMAKEGICLVISPLISLMKDQIDNLKKKNIKAGAIYSGMSITEIEMMVQNARSGYFKFLYISPERLETARMRESIKKMKVNLLAVDEAHCISQWGYDFRPPYLNIADIRELIPKVPVLALTATATPKVVEDIQKRLRFPKPNVLQKSFERKNLTYFVFHEEDKRNRILNIIKKVNGPGVIYVRNRRETKVISDFLLKNRISSTFYHAGLDTPEREKRQLAWMKEEKKVIVATNAFGMGIDKPNVRFVIHIDLPDSLEAYFQEAGRAGRDEKSAFAVLLVEKSNIIDARQNLENSYPEIKTIRNVYQSLCNFYGISPGTGMDYQADFNLTEFTAQYRFQPLVVYNSLKFLEKEGYIILNEAIHQPSRLYIKADKESLYSFQVEHADLDPFIKTIMRSYGGIFTEYVTIHEEELAKRANLSTEKVIELLKRLKKMDVLDYVQRSDFPKIIFSQNRIDAKDLFLSPENYRDRLKDAETRLEAVISYAENSRECRNVRLLRYFGDKDPKRCGKCDVCIERNKMEVNDLEFENISSHILPLLKTKPSSIMEIVAAASPCNEDKIIKVLQWLLDREVIHLTTEGKYFCQD